jgi:hypothetical protein
VNFSYVVPVRIESPHRRRNLALVLEWLSRFMSAHTILVEHGPTRNLSDADLPPGATYRYIQDAGPFNKGRAMNIGFHLATDAVIVFGDADMVMPHELIERSCMACERTLDAVDPYHRLIDLSESDSITLDPASLPSPQTGSVAGEDRAGYRETLCFAGGVFVVRREFYETIGGMDESFHGWGGEDNAMSTKILRMTTRCAVAKEGVAFHLWHPRRRPESENADYRANLQRADSYRTMSDVSLAALCQEQRENLRQIDSIGADVQSTYDPKTNI